MEYSFLIFVAAAVAVVGIYSVVSDLYIRDRTIVGDRLGKQNIVETREKIKELFSKEGIPQVADEDPSLATRRQRIEVVLLQSGLEMTFEQLMQYTALSAMALGSLAALLAYGALHANPLIIAASGVLVASAGAMIPFAYVSRVRKKRLAKLNEQLSDAFDLMQRVIRAGQTIPQAMQAVGREFPRPISTEFAICSEQQNLGMPADDAMQDLARRCGLIEVKIFAVAMIVQRQTGGSMAGLLANLAHIVRERFRIKGEIRTLTAESRMQAWALLGLPPGLGIVFKLLNPKYMDPLTEHPGYYFLIGMFVAEFLGWLWIRKIVNFDF